MAVKQTAGRDALGEFAPKFAELNDDVLFGEVWSREEQLSLRDRSLVTVIALMAQGLTDESFRYAPLGYRKSEADKHVLEIDPVTAPVVRHIFDLRLQGYGFRKIALQLNAEKVPAPRSFYYMAEGRENLRGETPFWNDVTVKTILRNEVYIGHMVQNKTGTVSYKNHKQVSKPESEWIKVENTHEPLISQETWDAVQRMDNYPARGRSGKSGTIALFGGLLRCMDCGSSMRYMRDYRKKVSEKEPEYKAYVCNR